MRPSATSAVPPTADIVGQRGHVRKVPTPEVECFTQPLCRRWPEELVARQAQARWRLLG
jgi:hypothetical protein